MKFIKILCLVLAITLLLAACKKDDDNGEVDVDPTPTPPDEPPVVREVYEFTPENLPRMDGSPATIPLAQALAAVLLGETRENVQDLAVFTRTTEAFNTLAGKRADILIVSEPTPNILSFLSSHGIEFDMAPIATDALVFVVSESNPIDNLTIGQLRAIYSGEITNWQQIGGEDSPIVAFQRNEEAASQILMEKLVMDWQIMAEPPVQILPSDSGFDESITAIKGFDNSANAIGYSLYHYAVDMGMAEGLKILSIDGVLPDTYSISNGRYPFLNPYYAVINTHEPEDSSTRILFNWLLSDFGQEFISSQGYVSIKDSPPLDFEVPSPPEMRWDIKIDDSRLTPYISPFAGLSRLDSSSLSELIPSHDYAMILPYSSAITMNDGSLRISKYGFVTQNGMIITNPIYDDITRAALTTFNDSIPQPAYHLRINTDAATKHAVVAFDGSWITSFDYENIVFHESIFLAIYENETYNIDVYDYGGNLLYNIMELEWFEDIEQDTWPEFLIYTINDGFGFIQMSDGNYAVLDVLTGEIEETDFIRAFMFSEGLAAVIPRGTRNNLWGFINKDLELVIQPGYVNETAFRNGRAVVERTDGSQHIINLEGEVLFSVGTDQFILTQHDGYAFAIYPKGEWGLPTLYRGDFVEVSYPNNLDQDLETTVRYLENGWYSFASFSGVWVSNGDVEYKLPNNKQIVTLAGSYIIVSEMDSGFIQPLFSVITLSGEEIIEAKELESITPVFNSEGLLGFIFNTSKTYGDIINEYYRRAEYSFVDLTGQLIKSGLGVMFYDEATELFFVQGTDYFAWIGFDGNYFSLADDTSIKIPSMAYSFD
ncbi:MAG: substrate-binding domain-containing protein [Oscillospiraceae bacterium]|jgi:phosphate transport system substrate-binding protein|nr:substrate-binding domain-containing protein [Oscillospiraceae bacterium]